MTDLAAIILQLTETRGPEKSICPTDAARAADPENWRRLLPKVRATAIALAREGRLVITRHNKPVDPDAFRGVYRLRQPAGAAAVVAGDAGAEAGFDGPAPDKSDDDAP